MSASLVLGSIYCLSCLVLVFGVREQPGKSVRVQPGGEGGVAEVLWVPKGGNVWSSPHRDVKRQLLAQLSCTRTRRRRPPVPPIAAPATPLSLPRAPQPPGEGWAALHPLPEDDRGTQALHPAALWLPLRLPGLPGARAASAGGELGWGEVTPHAVTAANSGPYECPRVTFPGHAGDFCFLLYPRCGAGREIPAFGARHAGEWAPASPHSPWHRCQPARTSPGQRPAALGDIAELLWFLLRSQLPSPSPSGSGFWGDLGRKRQ